MKRFVAGVIIGALVMLSASAFADSAGLVGQKVQGLFTVEKSGTKIADAVIINGSAYAPVRAVAEAAGAKLTVEGKKIIMEEASVGTQEITASELKTERDSLIAEIEQKKENILDLETNVIPPLVIMAKELATNGDLGKRAEDSAAEYTRLLEQRKAELAELQTQLTEINAQLDAAGE